MKYLKSYKLFESVDVIKSTIEDILRDNVSDKDIALKIYHITNHTDNNNNPIEVIKIQIGDDDYFTNFIVRVDELKEDILTVTNYLEDEGFEYHTFCYMDDDDFNFDVGDVLNSNGLETTYLTLFYKKPVRESYLERLEIQDITSIVNDYLRDSNWDIKNSLGNCAFFAKDFYEWCQKRGIDCKLIYLKQDENFAVGAEIEDHIIPMVDNQLIDFVYTEQGVSRRVRKDLPEAIFRQFNPEITLFDTFREKYSKWGYNTVEEISYQDAYVGNNSKCQTIDYPNKLNETIKVPIEVGDTVLGGRFKNKKIVVKKIGKNKKGDITINDKPLLKFRLVKESLQEDVDHYFRHLEDDNFLIQVSDDYFRIIKPIESDFYTYRNCKLFQWSEIAGEIERYITELDDKSVDYAYVVKRSADKYESIYDREQIHTRLLLDETFDCGEIISFTIGFK